MTEEFPKADMWCHFGTAIIRGPDEGIVVSHYALGIRIVYLICLHFETCTFGKTGNPTLGKINKHVYGVQTFFERLLLFSNNIFVFYLTCDYPDVFSVSIGLRNSSSWKCKENVQTQIEKPKILKISRRGSRCPK